MKLVTYNYGSLSDSWDHTVITKNDHIDFTQVIVYDITGLIVTPIARFYGVMSKVNANKFIRMMENQNV